MKIKAFIDDFNTIRLLHGGALDSVIVYNGLEVPCETISHSGSRIILRTMRPLELALGVTVRVGGENVAAQPLGILSGEEFDERFSYDGQLGNFTANGKTVFRLWAPLAGEVLLNIYDDGAEDTLADERGKMTVRFGNVWEYTCTGDISGKYYTYTVDGVETLDPYAHTAGLNGVRGMVLDFAADGVVPAGWADEREIFRKKFGLKKYTDAVIWETHVRDFSMRMHSSKHKGKYLAFTESAVNEFGRPAGVDYLAALGITHVHLLPIAEYATVDQRKPDGGDYNKFNWGYDPLSHNVPSGVYSENPACGSTRVREVREMTAALHRAGIGVVLDVVFNHTYNFECPLGRTFREYYYRRDEMGGYTDGSGCGNELASERKMCRRYIVDSLKFWSEQYHIDGFRFDLMGVTDLETMRLVEKELRAIDPNVIIYGEGWTGGASSLAYQKQSNKYNVVQLPPYGAPNIAVFSDIIRDGIKGEVFRGGEGGYVNGRAWENVGLIKYCVMGGTSANFGIDWVTSSAAQCINYVSAHDNHTLWDKIFLTGSDRTYEERLRINKMAAAIYMTCQGIPFMQSGEEFLRSKPIDGGFDHNSYRSPDEVNNLRWGRIRQGSAGKELSMYYRGLITFRKAHACLRLTDPDEIEQSIRFIDVADKYEVITFRLKACGGEIYVVYNPLSDTRLTLPGGKWALCIDGERSGTEILSVHSGDYLAKAQSVCVFEKQ